ncbi:MAG: hypothetical protein HND57_15455 [Planctomycetes bacterium]|nr:hypothetical protein [Planctomycetota bacterium]
MTDNEAEGYATLSGNLVVQYLELDRRAGEAEPRQLTLRADRAVIFTDPISETDVRTGQLKADQVRGIYLEGNVSASDGNYTLRGPQMYYEFHTNRAIVPEAVLYTYSRDARVPLYLRASELRQVNDRSWEGDDIRLSTSEFFTPTISLGASHVRIDRVDRVVRDGSSAAAGADGTESGQVTDGTEPLPNVRTRHYAHAENATIRLGDLPVFWWPGYDGPAENLPLKQLEVGANSRDGMRIATRWDLFSLSRGLSKFDNGRTSADLILQYMSDRGPAVGLDLNYGFDEGRGSLFGYLMQDDGTDRLSSGREIEVDDETRGMIDFWHRQDLPDDWTVILEASYLSDPAFLDSRFEEWAETRREYQSRIYARQQRDNWALELFANYDLNDSVPNEDYLLSRGYNVEKLPEIGYYRLADSLFGGKVSYSSEYRLSRMRLSLPRHTLGQIGQSSFGFGYDPDEELATAMYNAGFRETMVNRFHTRHEMAFPFSLGAIKINPFIMGRLTSYDDNLEEYSDSAEELWWFGAAGVRASVQFWNVNNNIDNRFFDVHRMRHIMEPSVTLWSGSSDASGEDFPIYDADIEGVTTGSVVSFALRNTWQTQRGGPGRWRSVDMLRLDGEVVFHGSETQGQYDIPRFFDFRPEYSRFGDHARGELAWLVSDSLAIAGHVIYDMNESAIARSSVGYRIDHGRGLFTYADLRYFDANDDTLLGAGLGYRLTSRYRFQGSTTFDLNQSDARSISASLTRSEQQIDLTVGFWYDQFREETSVILYLSPKGTGGRSYGGVFRDEGQARR